MKFVSTTSNAAPPPRSASLVVSSRWRPPPSALAMSAKRTTLVYVLTPSAVRSELHAVGGARRIEPAGSAVLCEARIADNRYYVVRRVCGAVADVECAMGGQPVRSRRSPSGASAQPVKGPPRSSHLTADPPARGPDHA